MESTILMVLKPCSKNFEPLSPPISYQVEKKTRTDSYSAVQTTFKNIVRLTKALKLTSLNIIKKMMGTS